MKILRVETDFITIPLIKPFKTALRQTSVTENIIVKLITDDGEIGWGSASPTAVITGDTIGSIKEAIINFIAPSITGMDIDEFDNIMKKLNACILKNTSAKAAVDMALYDLLGKRMKMPLYKILGGCASKIESDITISVNSPEEMAADAINYVSQGYDVLKTKVGVDAKLDLVRIKAIRDAIGYDIPLRLDANQGWSAKEAIRTIRVMEDKGMNIEIVEQPVKAHDYEGLKYVTDNVETPIMADESLFSEHDAFELLKTRAVDILNIKLMKTGGIHNALKVNAMAESVGVECMIGCMMESKIGITAATHLACGKGNITRYDLDAYSLSAIDPFDGGAIIDKKHMSLTDDYGLGIKGMK